MTRRRAISGAVVAILATPFQASARERAALYQATAIVTGTDTRQRPLGFARCLTEVFVKLTGMPKLVSNPSVAALAEHADALVASFAYIDPRAASLHHDDQGTYDRSYELTVRFDPAKVDAALAGLGLSIWTGPRPLLNPIVLVRDREPAPFLLSAAAPRGIEMRQAVTRFAGEFGIGVRFPTDADLAEWSVGLLGFPAPLADPSAGLARVTGTLSWNVQAMGWIGSWRMQCRETEHEWEIRGVGFDEALGNMVSGAVMLAAGTGVP